MNIPEIGREIATQDNLATAHPLFLVQQRIRDYGYDPLYCDSCVWVDEEGEELDNQEEGEEPQDTWTGYRDRWEYVQTFFTRAAALQFIDNNKHRYYNELRIYVDSGYRNPEWQTVRQYLIQQGEENAE